MSCYRANEEQLRLNASHPQILCQLLCWLRIEVFRAEFSDSLGASFLQCDVNQKKIKTYDFFCKCLHIGINASSCSESVTNLVNVLFVLYINELNIDKQRHLSNNTGVQSECGALPSITAYPNSTTRPDFVKLRNRVAQVVNNRGAFLEI